MYPRRQYNSTKQLKIPNCNYNSERELSRGHLKLAERDASKENCYPSDITRKSNYRQRQSVSKDRRRDEFSSSPSGFTKKHSYRRGRSFSRDESCGDSEEEGNAFSEGQSNSRKQLKALERKCEYIHRRLRLADREPSEERYYSSDDEAVKQRCSTRYSYSSTNLKYSYWCCFYAHSTRSMSHSLNHILDSTCSLKILLQHFLYVRI